MPLSRLNPDIALLDAFQQSLRIEFTEPGWNFKRARRQCLFLNMVDSERHSVRQLDLQREAELRIDPGGELFAAVRAREIYEQRAAADRGIVDLLALPR